MRTRILSIPAALFALLFASLSPAMAETAYTETNTLTVDTRGIWLGNVEIMVMDGTTGNMIPDALVTAASQNKLTDSGGMARFNNLPAADYTFSVVKSGYVSADVKKMVVAGGTRVYAVPLYAGTSVDMAQIPFAGAKEIQDIAPDGSERTKVLTHYRLNGTAPDYTVSLRYRRGDGAWTNIAPASLAHYGGNAPDFGAGVKPGDHSVAWDVATDLPNMHEPMLQVEITATRSGRTAVKETSFITVDTRGQTLGTLTGRIVKTDSTPLAGATVLLMPHDKSVGTGADGTFSLTGLVPGSGCNVRVSAAGYQPYVKGQITVPATSLNLGDLTLTAEARQMLVRPLNPNPNPNTLSIPYGGTGYVYYRVLSADGINSCPGQTVQLETSVGTLIPQSATPHENWAGPIAGISDKDGIVRLEVPANSIGGIVGALINVRIRATPTIAPDTANFPAGSGGSVFSVLAEVVPREWEQVKDMRINKSITAGVYLAAEDVAEQRLYYSGTQLTGENVSSQTVLSGGIGWEVTAGPVFPGVEIQGQVGVHASIGFSGRDDYYFPAGTAVPAYGGAFKSCLALRGQLPLTMPGRILQDQMNAWVNPGFVPFDGGWEGGLVGSLGTNASLNMNIGAAVRGSFLQLGGGAGMDAGLTEEGFVGVLTSKGREGKSDAYVWTGITAEVDTQASVGINIMPSFETVRAPDGGGVLLKGAKISPKLSTGVSVNKTLGMKYYPGYRGKAKKVELVYDRGYTDPGRNLDFREDLDLGSFPAIESVTNMGETRQFETVWSVARADAGEFTEFDSNRFATVGNYTRWYDQARELSGRKDYRVSYERRVALGDAAVNADLSLSLWVVSIDLGCKSRREAESPVESGRLWNDKQLPLWTSAPATKGDIPSGSMLTQIKDWSVSGASDFVTIMGDKVTKTVQPIGDKVVNIYHKLNPFDSPAKSPLDTGGPSYAPSPPAEDGWENYGISGLYELTSETPISTPVSLEISYTSDDLGGGNAADLAAYYFVPETAEWQLVPSTLNATAQIVTVDATRTGFYGLALPQPAGKVQLVLDGAAPLPADGTTTATVRATGLVHNNGQLVPNGTLYTITATGVTLTGIDASPTVEGFQVAAANGMITIGIQAPAGGVGATVTAEVAETGTAKGTLEIALRDTTPPPAPDGLTLSGAGSALRVSWSVSTATDVTGYRVYYKVGVAGPPWDGVSNIEGDASPLFTDESIADLRGLSAGNTYYVAVAAVDEAGQESALSTPASLLLQATPPAAPTAGTVVKGATGAVFLSWGLSADDLLGQRNVDHYEIRRRLPGAAWTAIGTAASGQNTYGDTWPAGLAAGEYPEYAIVPVSTTGTTGDAGGTVFDSDSDTLPDPWEAANGVNPFDPADATANGDGDHRNNLEEYLAGSFPGVSDGTDFRVTQFATETSTNGTRLADPGTVRLSWNAEAVLAPGESYIVEASQTLADGSWQQVADAQITVVNRTGVAVVTRHADRPREFYRIAIAGRTVVANYSSWIGGFQPGVTDPSIIAATADPDRDSIPNAVEMVLGGNPATGLDASLLPSVETITTDLGTGAADYFLFTYRRTDLSVAAGVSSYGEYSNDLSGPWIQAVDGTDGVEVVESPDFHGAGIDRVRVYIPRGSNARMFGRLRVALNPDDDGEVIIPPPPLPNSP